MGGIIKFLSDFFTADEEHYNANFDIVDDEFYLREPSVNLKGDSIDGGELYFEADYIDCYTYEEDE